MFESFLSNLLYTLSSILAIVVVVIVVYVLCLCIFASMGRSSFLTYMILRDQIRLANWFIRSIRKHWRFFFALILFGVLYAVFYSALPDWAEAYTMQRQLISLFSSTMITVTAVLLAKRKMKWLLRLVSISTASITTITAIYLYVENAYLVLQLTAQPFPFELLALVLIPSIISVALAKKFHWTVKTRHQPNKAYLNQNVTSNKNNSNPDYPDNPAQNPYKPAHSSNARENRGLTKVEKAYGVRSGREHNSNATGGARNREEGKLRQLLESEERRTKKNYEKLFPENQWDEDTEEKMEGEE